MDNLEIRIFISSTFNTDMLEARDAFRNELLAKLNAIAGQIQGNVFLNDFELGIPEGTPALTVVCTCIDAIMSSDYFIGILGESRGTMLSEFLCDAEWEKCRYNALIREAIDKQYTVLELEFLCAIQAGIKSHFYLDSKKTINEFEHSIENYLFSCNQSIQGFTTLENLKRSVVDVLEAEWNLNYTLFASYTEEEKDRNIILANKLRYYIPQNEIIQKIDEYIQSNERKVLWIIGKEGCGKSTVLFDWFNMNLNDTESNILYYSTEYTVFSLDDLLFQIIYEIGKIENFDYISEFNNLTNDLERIEYFKKILENCKQSYILLIDGIEHVISKEGIKSSYCFPDHLHTHMKIIATWGEDYDDRQGGLNYCINSFDISSFAENFFKREGKVLIYEKYKEMIIGLLYPEWQPDAIRLMLSCIILAAKYNNIESVIADFSREYEKYRNPYCSYIAWLNKYFTYDGNEPLKEALLLLYNSDTGLSITMLQQVVHGGEKLKDIFNVIYFVVRKNTNNRYLLGGSQLKSAIKLLYGNELSKFAKILSNLNYRELLSNNLEYSFDAWVEYIEYLYNNRDRDELKSFFAENLGKIANIWYYDRNLIISVFELIKDEKYIEQIKNSVFEDTESNAPFFISHLFYIYGYYKDAEDVFRHILSDVDRYNLSEIQFATIFNNMGLYLFEEGEDMGLSEKYLLEGYELRKKHIVENIKDYFESCDNLFNFYYRFDKEKAHIFLQEEIQLCETCFRENSFENYKCYTRRAWWEEDADCEKAIFYYDKALMICDIIFDSDNLHSAKVLQMKTDLFLNMENYGQALECGLKAYGIYDRMGIFNDDCARTCFFIAITSMKMETNVDAAKGIYNSRYWFKKTLEILKTISIEDYNNVLNFAKSAFADENVDYWENSDG